jgi:uncharacterized membrane protein YozB (DUF420 family)
MPVPDANLLFWAASLANLGLVVVCGVQGVKRIRHRDVRGHRRMMITASGLVFLFLFSYVLKVMFLGREDREVWTQAARTALYLHETAVLVMLVAGSVAVYRALRFRHTLGDELSDPVEASRHGRLVHRRAGRTAVVASIAAFVTAAFWLALYASGR